MKLSKNWKRIIAGLMAATMVFLSIDGGCISALAAEIQEWNNEKANIADYPTGYQELELYAVDMTEYSGDVYEYKELANVQTYSEIYNCEWDKYATNFYYNQLSDEWKEVWEATDALCRACLTTEEDVKPYYTFGYYLDMITLPENTLMNDGIAFINLFMASNPQYYFLDTNLLHSPSDGNIYMLSFGLGVYENFADGEIRATETAKFKTSIETILDEENISSTASDSEKLEYVHDYIINKVDYNYDILDDNGYIIESMEETAYTQSAYSALCMDYTVCAGYAEALQLLCNAMGVDSLVVTSVDHMWNKVRINNSWYNVDATWADNGKTEGVNNPIYYGYYGRSDEFYEETDTNVNASSHISESLWGNYLPECTKDTNPTELYEPGDFYVPTETLPAPVISVKMNSEQKYDVTISVEDLDDTYSGVTIYYTLDGTDPSVASSKSYVYSEPFSANAETTVKAVAVLDGYYDSAIAEKTVISTLYNATIQSHFYKELTFTWDALGEMVDGYTINVYNGANNTKIGQSINVSGGSVDFYAYDTSQLTEVTSVYYDICGYILDDEQNKHVITNVAKSTSENINLLTKPLDAKVKWHVTTNDGVKYLVINVEETTQQQLCLWYYSDTNGVDLEKTFTLNMVGGVNEFKYSFDSHGIPYDEVGYVYITDGSKTTAFQDECFAVGGEYKAPVLNPIVDIELQSTGETVVLEASIAEDSVMENFNYKYQWYIAEDSTSEGTVIADATKSSYTVQIDSFDEQYYYCVVTVEYLENKTFTTNNGAEIEAGHTRIEGALYGTEISKEPIANRVFTGSPITVDDLVLKNALNENLVLGRDYTVSYENNTNAGQATIIVDFIGDYGGVEDARINFKIEAKEVTDDSSKFEFTDITDVYTYNGAEHLPAMSVKDVERAYVLVKDVDYDIEYRGNVDAGTATIVLEFKGNYQGEKDVLFKIQPKSAANVVVSPISDITYTGKEIIPELEIKDNEISKTLELNKDYKIVSCVNNITVGGATVIIEFIKNYEGENRELSFNITRKNAADADVLITAIDNQEYTGNEIKPIFKVVYNDDTLKEGTDYTAVYSSNVDVGDATITLTFRNNFEGTKTTTFKIVAKDAENLIYSDITEVYTYDGTEHKPENIVVQNGDKVLQENLDYVILYENNIDAGKGIVKVSFDGFDGESKHYTGEKILEFEIKSRNIMDHQEQIEITVEKLQSYTYDGAPKEPGVTVVDKEILNAEGNNNLVEDKDFKVSYVNNINAGSATIIIDFIGNYDGHSQKEFTIIPKEIGQSDIEVEAIDNQTYNGEAIIPDIVVKENGVILRLNNDYTVTGTDNINVGTAYLKVSILLDGNYIYMGGDIEVSFIIEPREAKNVEILRIDPQEYTGSAITPDLLVQDNEINITLVAGRDYIATYSDNVEVGTATVEITFTGNFTGDPMIATFTIIDPIPEYITSSVFNINQTNGYISKVTVGTTVYTLWSSLNEREYVNIYDRSGNVISGENVLATGMTAGIVDEGSVVKRYTVIVTGDTNGDGKINITDMIAVKACTLKKSGLSGAYEKAGDVNGDGKINITDFIKVKATTLKKDTIVGVSVN